ncbi:DUF7878 domain-containing protein [Virgibacillus halodenitrificans]|uniref:DUF7878 domain-containing protein n=1 Tax=Virgibacillus halodenitrificans TaxID=1482 RepID=UPI001F368352|nr:hypothetical protein [Virgibacillus halodenitrificans]
MDNASSQINISFNFISDISNIDYKKKKDFSNVYNIQGMLNIRIENELFFSEEIALLEFYIQVKKWLSNKFDGSFYYNTIEVEGDDNPLIKFVASDNNYFISSPWGQDKVIAKAKAESLIESIKIFTEDFEEELYRTYKLNPKWYI